MTINWDSPRDILTLILDRKSSKLKELQDAIARTCDRLHDQEAREQKMKREVSDLERSRDKWRK